MTLVREQQEHQASSERHHHRRHHHLRSNEIASGQEKNKANPRNHGASKADGRASVAFLAGEKSSEDVRTAHFQRLPQLVKNKRGGESEITSDGASVTMLSEEDVLSVALGLADKASNYSYQ